YIGARSRRKSMVRIEPAGFFSRGRVKSWFKSILRIFRDRLGDFSNHPSMIRMPDATPDVAFFCWNAADRSRIHCKRGTINTR
ncbi:MAG: hypothetical protein AAF802_27070, partial [Planctomycetota bacterium]